MSIAEESWITELRKMLAPDLALGTEQDKWFGIIVHFIKDLCNEAYRQGRRDAEKEHLDPLGH